MLIKFANTDVEAWKVRQGVVVLYQGELYHVSSFVDDSLIQIHNAWNDTEAFSQGITWLEPH